MTTLAPTRRTWDSRRYRDEIDAELRASLASLQLPLHDMLRYHLGWLEADGSPGPGLVGKALRPTLCLLASDAVSGRHDRALPTAAAVELVHNFSLIHDDVQDGDRQRRHRPTVWSVWGQPQAINAGTATYAAAALALERLADHGVPAEMRLRANATLHRACLRLLEGQYLDLAFETRTEVSVDEYLAMVGGKTAALIAASLALGALVADPGLRPAAVEHDRRVDALARMGEHLGLAFQIRDDMLGIWGDEDATGKPVGADIRARKKSLPIVAVPGRRQHRLSSQLDHQYAG